MPSIAIPNANAGILVGVWVGLALGEKQNLRNLRLPIPPDIFATALIDTGCDRTCVDLSILSQLGLIGTQSGKNSGQIATANGIANVTQYGVNIIFDQYRPCTAFGNTLINGVPVGPLVMQQKPFTVLIGRNILSRCILHYDGAHNQCTLDLPLNP